MRHRARRKSESDGDAISAFWQWWQQYGMRDAQRILAGRADPGFFGDINARVTAINPELTWELGPGQESAHSLVVTASGVAGPRRDAERWRRAGPAPDGVWEYYPARQPNRDPFEDDLQFNGRSFAFSDFRFTTEVVKLVLRSTSRYGIHCLRRRR